MRIVKTAKKLRQILDDFQGTIGFVPTMGALHQGHMSLIQMSRESNDLTVCSIFVNPTQFDNQQDLDKYPRSEADDIIMLAHNGCDIVYIPEASDIYPDGMQMAQPYDLGYLETILEGEFRKGHYQGVAQVVSRLLKIVQPDSLFLGAKDFQQIMVIQKMIAQDNLKLNIITVPTLRESNGLAMSSRNRRLNESQKEDATAIYKGLLSFKNRKGESFDSLKKQMHSNLLDSGFTTIDYIALADANTLDLLENFDESRPMIVLVAAYMNPVRLIDNMII